ncbi:hypothetical protein GCK72_009720 [Caenorhabditis remanei]|uniref:Peptidyl-prolyl cis-trans isomerase n=1 Tax=Caenorhabditis remanei TaxID=31234 RepID=A0A6A5H3Z5_CAERE|nr:hypothetical protein GCK72_009720 [Caenorhabditis remanei]KAF1761464.1 hypothetical protein GCK72_009720 [Caenorhabditis remanei]
MNIILAPKTCENFRALCTGEVGMAPNNKARLHYKGSEIHRIVRKFMIQGGDITDGDGRGGFSVYGRYFDDEKFVLKHTKPYLLSMANKGPNSNSSQFFITTAPAPHCNGKHVVFGEVVRGQETVDLIENLDVDEKSKPRGKVLITNCGEMIRKKKLAKTEEEMAALEAKKKKEASVEIPDVPKSWLYRDNDQAKTTSSTTTGKPRRRERSRSKSREYRPEVGRRGDHDSRRMYRDVRKDDFGIKVRGRGGVQFRRERSVTPDHWKQNKPSKWTEESRPVDLLP